MARRRDNKFNELNNIIDFVRLVIMQLETTVKNDSQKKVVQELKKQKPKFNYFPRLERTYSDILDKVANGNYSPQIAIAYFERERRSLTDKLNSL
jgi:hypothetical protein